MADKPNDYFVISRDEKTLIHYFNNMNGMSGATAHPIAGLVYCANLGKNEDEKITTEEYIKNLRKTLNK